jgi:hypothetical protein
MAWDLSTRERLELFTQRVAELRDRRLVRNGMNTRYTVSWTQVSRLLTQQTIEPDEEDLRSFLLVFRQFISDREPVFISRAFNDCLRLLDSGDLREQLAQAQEAWRNAFRGMGALHVTIDGRNLTGEYVLDLWINGYYFHNDSNKTAELRRYIATQDLPLVRFQFLSALAALTDIILYLGAVVEYSLREGLFNFPAEAGGA